jgi:hypothetical protein
VKKIRDAIQSQSEVSACLLNYKKDGSTFINQVDESLQIDFLLPLQYLHDKSLTLSFIFIDMIVFPVSPLRHTRQGRLLLRSSVSRRCNRR